MDVIKIERPDPDNFGQFIELTDADIRQMAIENMEATMPEVIQHRTETLDIAIDDDHSLHAVIEDGELSAVTISSKSDPEDTEDFVFKGGLQGLSDAVGRMADELTLRSVPHG